MSGDPDDIRAMRAASFNEDAKKYDRARPKYPELLFDELWSVAALGDCPKVVEVGCGTGQASVSLARRGAELTCVEFGANMADIAKRNLAEFPSARVVVSKFEDWDTQHENFDLVFASASWHWVRRIERYRKAQSVLRPGACLAVVHSSHFYPDGFDPLFTQIQDIYHQVTGSRREVKAQSLPPENQYDSDDEEHISEMLEVGGFKLPKVVRLLWHFDRSADEYIDLLGTYSDHWALDPAPRAILFEGIHRIISDGTSGTIRKHYLTTLRVAQKNAIA